MPAIPLHKNNDTTTAPSYPSGVFDDFKLTEVCHDFVAEILHKVGVALNGRGSGRQRPGDVGSSPTADPDSKIKRKVRR